MSGRFVRSSKYRHVFGRPTRKDQCFDNLRVSRNAWDSNLVKANPEYLAVNWDSTGGGAFAVLPTSERGKLPDRIPLFRGHTAVVLDTDWNPFNDSLIASGSDDGKVFLWRVPDDFAVRLDLPADQIQDVAPVGKLSGHPKKVGHVLFNPAAENVLASASGDFTVKIWDVEAGSAKLSLKVGDAIQSMSWSANGALLVTTSRDKKLRIWDARQEKPAQETAGHQGAKNSRSVWMGEHDRIATTGFSRMSERQLALWDIKAPRQPVDGFQMLDSMSGVCIPFWDDGTQCLYLAGKGDGNIRYYEYENDKFEYLSEYKSADPQRGIAFLPKRGVNMHENEVARAYKTVSDSYIEPISFIVPRRSETFQDDIYPPTVGLKPAVSNREWFDGADGLPSKISLESLYEGTGILEVPSESLEKPVKEPVAAKPSEKATKEVEDQEPEKKTPVSVSGPPPSIKEQGNSMMAVASKFEDDEAVDDDNDDDSSFEEVQKPTERTFAAIKPTASQTLATQTTAPAPSRAKEEEVPQKVESPIKSASKPLPTVSTAAVGGAKSSTEEAEGETAEAPVATATATSSSPTTATATDALERELHSMKAMMAQQTRLLASMSSTVQDLVSEVKALKRQ